jgi:hypothetical protein
MTRDERVKKMLALVATQDEEEEAQAILQAACFRRACYEAYLAAGFSPEVAISFIQAELAAPEIYIGGGEE